VETGPTGKEKKRGTSFASTYRVDLTASSAVVWGLVTARADDRAEGAAGNAPTANTRVIDDDDDAPEAKRSRSEAGETAAS
jgi:hypothetical protein